MAHEIPFIKNRAVTDATKITHLLWVIAIIAEIKKVLSINSILKIITVLWVNLSIHECEWGFFYWSDIRQTCTWWWWRLGSASWRSLPQIPCLGSRWWLKWKRLPFKWRSFPSLKWRFSNWNDCFITDWSCSTSRTTSWSLSFWGALFLLFTILWDDVQTRELYGRSTLHQQQQHEKWEKPLRKRHECENNEQFVVLL